MGSGGTITIAILAGSGMNFHGVDVMTCERWIRVRLAKGKPDERATVNMANACYIVRDTGKNESEIFFNNGESLVVNNSIRRLTEDGTS